MPISPLKQQTGFVSGSIFKSTEASFTMFLIYLSLCLCISTDTYIKVYNGDKYLSSPVTDKEFQLVSKSEAGKFTIDIGDDGTTGIRNTSKGNVFDVAPSLNNKLMARSERKNPNQIFQLNVIDKDAYKVINKSLCMEDNNSGELYFRPCADLDSQKFSLVFAEDFNKPLESRIPELGILDLSSHRTKHMNRFLRVKNRGCHDEATINVIRNPTAIVKI